MAIQQALSDDEIQLRGRARRRLIGAVTLVTVMVVTLPMVLDGESKQPGQDIVISIPPQTSTGEFSSRIVPVQEQPIAKQEPVPAAVPAAAATPAPAVAPALAEKAAPAEVPAAPVVAQSPQPAIKKSEIQPIRIKEEQPQVPAPAQAAKTTEPESKKPVVAAAEPQPKPKEAPATRKDDKPAAKPESGTFVIQLGAFSSPANAKDRQAKLTALKVKFYTEKVKTASGERLRVRAGPYANRRDAERVLAKLKASGIKDGVVAEKKD